MGGVWWGCLDIVAVARPRAPRNELSAASAKLD